MKLLSVLIMVLLLTACGQGGAVEVTRVVIVTPTPIPSATPLVIPTLTHTAEPTPTQESRATLAPRWSDRTIGWYPAPDARSAPTINVWNGCETATGCRAVAWLVPTEHFYVAQRITTNDGQRAWQITTRLYVTGWVVADGLAIVCEPIADPCTPQDFYVPAWSTEVPVYG